MPSEVVRDEPDDEEKPKITVRFLTAEPPEPEPWPYPRISVTGDYWGWLASLKDDDAE